MSSTIRQIKEEVNLLVANGDEVIARVEAQDVDTPNTMLRAFKKAYPQARAQTTARIACEWTTKRMEQQMLNGNSGWLPSEEIMDTLCNELLCKGPIPNCNFPTINKFRTIDGTCNNLKKQTMGAAFTPFSRILPAVYEDGIAQPIGFEQTFILNQPFSPVRPSPRVISLKVIQRLDRNIDQPGATLMLMQWGQFLDHDYAYLIESSTLIGEEIECDSCKAIGECLPIPVPKNDPQFGVGTIQNGNCLPFIRSGVSCMKTEKENLCPHQPLNFDSHQPITRGPRQQLNQITHYIDASMVYGSLPEDESLLRDFRGGRLKEGKDRTLPPDLSPRLPCPGPVPCFRAGDLRSNEQVVLTVMHTIFLREHNRIATALQIINPHWNDERIYQEARKIVGAEVQYITYQEYLPEILGEKNLLRFLGIYEGYDPSVEAGIPNAFATAAYRFGHSQVPNYFQRLDQFGRQLTPLPLVDAFFNPKIFSINGGTDPLLRGLLYQYSRLTDVFVNTNLTNRLFERPKMPGMDLAALNIQRGRDHGLPSYREFRNFCTNKFRLRGQIKDQNTLIRLRELYNSEDNIDLWVGGLAEDPLPGAIIGPTFACILFITFKGLREGDRFYYENPGVFTPEQLTEIKKTSLSRIVCDNADNIQQVQPNAFSSIEAPRSCKLLPFIDLFKWFERNRNCYIRVQVRSLATAQAFLYTELDDELGWNLEDQQLIGAGSSTIKATCLQFTCPTTSDNFKFAIRVRRLKTLCQIGQINALPRNSVASKTTYYTTHQPMFGQRHGFYHSIETCQSGGGSGQVINPLAGQAITYVC